MNPQMNHQRKVNLQIPFKPPGRKDVLMSFILMVCQQTQVFGTFPFGCVFFTAISEPLCAYLYIPALILGAIWGGASVIKYLSASLIIWVSRLIIPEKNINHVTKAALCAGAVFVGGIYAIAVSSTPVYSAALLCGEALLCAVCTPVFENINSLLEQHRRNEPVSRENAISLVTVMAVLLWGLGSISLPWGISIKAVVAIFAVLCMTMYSSVSISVTFALVCGFLCSDSTGAALTVAGMFALCAALASALKYFGQLGAAVGFLSGVTICVLMHGETGFMSVSLTDIFIATLLFAVIPAKYHQRPGIFLANTFKSAPQRKDFRIREYIVEELNCISHTFSEFARHFKGSFQRFEENKCSPETLIFDETAERICSKCNRNADCWGKGFNDTYKYLNQIMQVTETSGVCTLHNAPIVFTQKCIQPELFLNEFNHAYELRKQELLKNGIRLGERNLVSNQYSEISKIIRDLSEEIEGSFFFDEQKEKQILLQAAKDGVFVRDVNVIRDKDGYYQMYFAPGTDTETQKVMDIASNVLDIPLKQVSCKNKAIIRLACDNSFEVKVTICQNKRENEEVCGDTVTHFATDKNKYYIILCDGMGGGEEAMRESRITAELLGGFLKSGFSKDRALSLINSTLALKMEREGFSTVDLCEIDLRSGTVEFIKVGGAPSYIKTEEGIETVSAKGLPVGLIEDIFADKISRTLSENDKLVMVSDGISEAGYGMMRGEWVKKLIKLDGLTSQELANSIVNSARKKIYPKPNDDMTAVVVELSRIERVLCEEAV